LICLSFLRLNTVVLKVALAAFAPLCSTYVQLIILSHEWTTRAHVWHAFLVKTAQEENERRERSHAQPSPPSISLAWLCLSTLPIAMHRYISYITPLHIAQFQNCKSDLMMTTSLPCGHNKVPCLFNRTKLSDVGLRRYFGRKKWRLCLV
jgi:hypothetical protein